MEFEEEYHALKFAKEQVSLKTAELAEAIAKAATADEALEVCLNPPAPGRMQSFLSEETRRATAEKAITATVQRLLQRRSKHIPN